METIAYLLPALGCAAMMGGMMWMMGRGQGGRQTTPPGDRREEIQALRDEVATLRLSEAGDQPASGNLS